MGFLEPYVSWTSLLDKSKTAVCSTPLLLVPFILTSSLLLHSIGIHDSWDIVSQEERIRVVDSIIVIHLS